MIDLSYSDVVTYVNADLPTHYSLLKSILTFYPDHEPEPKILYDSDGQFFRSGLTSFVCQELKDRGIDYDINFHRSKRKKLDIQNAQRKLSEQIELYDHQMNCVFAFLENGRGILEMGTGGGKTFSAIACIASLENCLGRKIRVVVDVDSVAQLQQFCSSLTKSGFGLSYSAVGGGHQPDLRKRILVGVGKSLSIWLRKDSQFREFVQVADFLIVDECHHLRSFTHQYVSDSCNAPYRLGISANPTINENPLRDYRDACVVGCLGKTIINIPSVELRREIVDKEGKTILPDPVVTMIPVDSKKFDYKITLANGREEDNAQWPIVERDCLIENQVRRELYRRLCQSKVTNEKTRCLTLVSKKYHGLTLLCDLASVGVIAVCSFGGNDNFVVQDGRVCKLKVKEKDLEGEFERGAFYFLICTPKYDEGKSLSFITDLVMKGGGRGGPACSRVKQRIGRALHSNNVPNIYDFDDSSHYMVFHQSRKRKELFQKEKYDVVREVPKECLTDQPNDLPLFYFDLEHMRVKPKPYKVKR